MSTRQTIENLLGKVALGDRDAFRQLYAYTSAKLFGICLRVLRDRAQAEDALQETFVKIWRNADKFSRRGGSPMSWLIAIARNQAIDVARVRAAPTSGLDEAETMADDLPDPERRAALKSEGRRIEKCMDELDNKHATAVRQAYVYGYTYDELATQFGVPVNTMRTWLRRSLLKLRECLER